MTKYSYITFKPLLELCKEISLYL